MFLPTIITLYCTPFFGTCKEKICENSRFFQNNFERTEQNPEDFPNPFPKEGKNRPQRLAEGEDPYKAADQKASCVADPQVTVTDGKAQIQPGPEGRGHKQKVGKVGVLRPQGAQKFIDDAQPRPQQAGQGKAPKGICRGGHPNSRRQKPPGARGSS